MPARPAPSRASQIIFHTGGHTPFIRLYKYTTILLCTTVVSPLDRETVEHYLIVQQRSSIPYPWGRGKMCPPPIELQFLGDTCVAAF